MRLLAVLLCLLTPLSLFAQTQDSDRGYIQGLLEDALSAEGRSVQLQGFQGALSSRATIDRITVTDPDGVWLTIDDVALQWNRSALLAGRIEIDEISAARLSLPRLPLPAEGEMPAPEASGTFSLPELPVSVNLAELRIDRAEIGAPVFGLDVALSLTGNAALSGGEGNAALDIQRLDRGGEITLDAAFDNASRQLRLDLLLDEPEGGIAATLLDLPGRPSVRLQAQGDDPLSDFTATVDLSTDGQDRLQGTVTLTSDDDGNSFALDVSGDVAPVFAPRYRDFLGDQIALQAAGSRAASGALALDRLSLSAAALTLEGTARIAADGWPEMLDLQGDITPVSGETVQLPLPGPALTVAGVNLRAQFDASQGDTWQIVGRASGVARDGFAAETLGFDGSGRIDRDSGQVTGDLALDGRGMDFPTDALDQAVGRDVQGRFGFEWTQGAPLVLSGLDLSGSDYGLTGDITVNGLTDPEALAILPDVTLAARDLSRFGALAGLDLSGMAELAVTGRIAPLTGLVDLALRGTTDDIGTGIAQLDPLLAGAGRLSIDVTRDEAGLRVDPVDIRTDHAEITAQVDLKTAAATGQATIAVTDLGRALDGVQGPARIEAEFTQADTNWRIDADASLPGQTTARVSGVIGTGERLTLSGTARAAIGQLETFAQLAGRDLAGSAQVAAQGTADLTLGSFDVTASGQTTDPRFGVPQAEALLEGTTQFNLAATRDRAGLIAVDTLRLDGPGLRGTVQGQFDAQSGDIRFDITAPELGRVSPQLAGAGSVNGTAVRSDGTWTVEALAALPGDATASVNATVSEDMQAQGRVTANVGRLAAWRAVAGLPLSGAIRVEAVGQADLNAGSFDVQAEGSATSFGIGNMSVDPLLTGPASFSANVARGADGNLQIRSVVLDATGIDARVSGDYGGGTGRLTYSVSVPQLGRIVPDFSGPATIDGTAQLNGQTYRINASGTGPGGLTARVTGTVNANGPRLNLSLDGSAPLALANAYLNGQAVTGVARFDLSVNGPPALSAVSGRVTLENARLSVPAQGIALNDIRGGIDLSGGRATLALTSDVSSGGRLRVTGPVALSAPFVAGIEAQLIDVTLRDASLFEAQLGGTVTVQGPLAGGARIGGAVDVQTVEMRLPTIGPSYSALDGLTHVGASPAVRQTLRYAGLDQPAQSGGAAPSYPIDLVVNAPNRIFVRGRGLDAELGGSLRLTGTTDDLIPQGQFDLIRGRLDLLGRRLTLTEGSVRLRGSFDPVIDFSASTTVEDATITLRIEGLASEPELTVTSSPSLPQEEALSLFLFGKDVTSISALQAVQLAAAIRTLTGQGGLGITGELRAGLGVDDLDIGTDADGQAQARVGKYISDNVYTDVTVTSGGDTEINLNLDLTDNVTVRGRVGSDGDTGIGIFFERDY